jgi:hypothetical protein
MADIEGIIAENVVSIKKCYTKEIRDMEEDLVRKIRDTVTKKMNLEEADVRSLMILIRVL